MRRGSTPKSIGPTGALASVLGSPRQPRARLGFSLHAATTAAGDDLRAREAIAQERLRLLPDDLVRIDLRHPFRDGTAR
jgi:hypothetical protein